MRPLFRFLSVALDVIMVIVALFSIIRGQGTATDYFILIGTFTVVIPSEIMIHRRNMQRDEDSEGVQNKDNSAS